MSEPDDELVFLDEPPALAIPDDDSEPPWLVLVVDDDDDVHEATGFALAGVHILGRPLHLLHALSGAEALAVLRQRPDVAVVLLDVVMESDDAGLHLVEAIRHELGLLNTRIVLRTGQPGHAPECETIARYDINDYKTKSELTQPKLYATLTSAIRAYDQLLRLDATREGLEKIVAASNQFIADRGLQVFADGVITQIAGLLGVAPEGLVCVAVEEQGDASAAPQYRVIAAAGHFSHLIKRSLAEINDPRIVAPLEAALRGQHSQMQRRSMALYFRKSATAGFAAFIDSARPLREVDRELLEVFCTNIALCSNNVDLVAELRRDAFIDRQMGLPNRTALLCEVDQRLHSAVPQALAVVDVDQFTATNDVLGHRYGDALLMQTAQRLATLPGGVFVARLAGDAFAVLGPQETVSGPAIQRLFREPMLIEEVSHLVSVSAGIVLLHQDSRAGIECLKDGYLALKRAKAHGVAQTVVFSNALGVEIRERAQLLRDLRLAFARGQLTLAYQPQVDMRSGRVLGMEALLRWYREDGSVVTPDRFIPIAEQSGLIVGIGQWLFHSALAALQRFRAQGFPELRMAVNVSPIQLRMPDFVSQVEAALHANGCAPTCLEVEVTESVAVSGLEQAVEQLGQLRAQGVTVAIDDFGTGYSSLSYLEQLPADRLKIDRSFMLALERGSRSGRIARTIMLLGRELGLTVLAEGVETAAVAEQVRQLGCVEAQGYWYAKPMDEAACMAWLQEQRR